MRPRLRLAVGLGGAVVAVAGPPPGGAAVAVAAVAAVVVERAAARALRAAAAPLATVVVALALQAWVGGPAAALTLAARVAGASAATAWLVATVGPGALVAALGGVGLPRALVELVALAARYAVVLGDSLGTAREAQRVRLGWQRLGVRVRSFGTLGGVVVARAIDQSAAVGDAMRARGGGRR